MSPALGVRSLVVLAPSSRRLAGLAASALLLAACGENKDPLDTVGNITVSAGPSGGPSGNPSGGDPSGDPTEGGTGNGTETGTGGPTEGTTTGGGAHGDCDQFLLCVGAISPDSLPEAEMAYGPDGTCWMTPEVMQECLNACSEGLAGYGAIFPDEPACGGSGSTTSTSGPITGETFTSTSEPWPSTGETFTSTTFPETSRGPDATTGGAYGNCGWDEANQYYGCGGVGEDPSATYPIECPFVPQVGDACTADTEINGIGCCLPNGDNFYCGGDNLVAVDSCGA